MASGGFTQENTNFFRTGSALLNVGTPTLRKLLELKASTTPGVQSVHNLLQQQSNREKLQRMNSRTLPRSQLELIYPSNGDSPDLSKWDITLMCLVLSTVCNLSMAEESYIRQIRTLRNTMYGHRAEASMCDEEFNSVWADVERAIEGLLHEINCPTITQDARNTLDRIKISAASAEQEEEIRQFLQREEDMSSKMETLTQMISMVDSRVDEIGQTIYQRSLEMASTTNQPPAESGLSKKDMQQHLLDFYENDSASVPVAPLWGDNEGVDISDLYVDLNIFDVTEKKVFQNSIGSNDGIPIYNEREMFHMSYKRSQRRYFLAGNAGSGKSTYCRKLVSTWCSALQKKLDHNEHLSEDETQMLAFDLVLLIPLCDMLNCSSVEEMLKAMHSQCVVPNLVCSIQTFLNSPDTRCLLILDGLDEWENQLDKNLKALFTFRCSILVATRHWALDRVPKKLQGRLLEIKPMEERNTRILVGNILHHVYRVSRARIESRVEHFMQQMKRNNLMEIVEIPLMLNYCVCLWHEEGGLDSSLTCNYGGIVDKLIQYCERRDLHASFSSKADQFRDTQLKLPSPLSFRNRCAEHSFVLYKLGYFAFEGCLQTPCGTITYDIQNLENRIGKAVLDMGLKIGIFSKRRVSGHVTHVKHNVQFLHRSIQEFLAALWVTSQQSETIVEMLKGHWTSLEKLLDLQTMFRFICGLKPSLYNSLAKFAATIASNSDEIQTYRHSLDTLYGSSKSRVNTYHVAKEIQDMLLMALHEAKCNWKYIGSKQGDIVRQHHGGVFYIKEITPKYWIQDLIVDEASDEMIGKILEQCKIKSIHIDTSKEQLGLFRNHMKVSEEMERLHLDSSFSSLFLNLPDQHIRRLRSLTVTLTQLVHLPEKFLHLRNVSALCLNITGSHEALVSLMDYFRNTSSLVELEIEQIQCRDHKGHSRDCKFTLDLSRNDKLKRLRIDNASSVSVMLMLNIELQDIVLHGRMRNPLAVLFCLPYSDSLTHLTLGDLLVSQLFEWDEEDVKAIAKVIPTFSKLKYVHLMGIDFRDNCLKFSEDSRQLETVYIEDVAMSEDSWKAALSSLLLGEAKLCKTSVQITSSSIHNGLVHFINETQRFGDVAVSATSDGYMIRFDVD